MRISHSLDTSWWWHVLYVYTNFVLTKLTNLYFLINQHISTLSVNNEEKKFCMIVISFFLFPNFIDVKWTNEL